MPTSPPPGAGPGRPTPEDLSAATERAMERARGRCRGAAPDDLINAAVDAVLAAARDYDPDRGPFGPLAGAYVRRAVRRARMARRRAPSARLAHDPADARPAAAAGLWADAAALPRRLKSAVELHCVRGYSMTDTGLLLGVSTEGVRKRLQKAGRLLGLTPPRRIRRR